MKKVSKQHSAMEGTCDKPLRVNEFKPTHYRRLWGLAAALAACYTVMVVAAHCSWT